MNTAAASMLLLLLVTAPLASADGKTRRPQFGSYFEASHVEYDIGGVDADPAGYRLNLSVALTDSFFAIVDRRSTSQSRSGPDFDFETESYGLGFHGKTWFASYTYNTWDMGANEFDVDTVRLGFRHRLTDYLEFNASYSWNDFEDADNHDGLQIGAVVKLTEHLNLIADYETIGGGRDIDYLSAGLRLRF